MRPEHLEALSALFDGERVDPTLLGEALADPGATGALADFVGLRILAREQRLEPSEAFYRRMDAQMSRSRQRGRIARILLPALAAGLFLAAGVTGYLIRDVAGPVVITVAQPPAPVRQAPVVLEWWPPEPAPSVRAAAAARSQRGAPPPSALRLRFLRWQEASAGLDEHPE